MNMPRYYQIRYNNGLHTNVKEWQSQYIFNDVNDLDNLL